MIPAIEIAGISKRYRNTVVPALKNISLTINQGRITGLLGTNGAGKTTLISIISGLISQSSGSIVVLQEINPAKYVSRIGLVPQEIALYPTLTAKENLRFYGKMYGVTGAELVRKIENLLYISGLQDCNNKLVNTFSGGMKRRLNLVAALIHDPEIIILDEPTVGVDVQSRALILQQLKKLREEGKTIVYTSHQMEEAEDICDELFILKNGDVAWKGSMSELKKDSETSNRLEALFLKVTNEGGHI